MKVHIGRYPKKTDTERKIKIQIDNYDCWNLDSTLALIIAPSLKKLKEIKHGAPYVDPSDVPDHLKPISFKDENGIENDLSIENGNTDNTHFQRWDWVIDEMIFAFESKNISWSEQFESGESDYKFVEQEDGNFKMEKGPNHTFTVDEEGIKFYRSRIDNGIRLFAKYYDALWD